MKSCQSGKIKLRQNPTIQEAHAVKIIPQDKNFEGIFSKSILAFFRKYEIAKLLRLSNADKCKGFSVAFIFLFLFSAVFKQRTVNRQLSVDKASVPCAKDTFYRFQNSCRTNWLKFTTLLANAVIRTVVPLTDDNRKNVLIIDDSMFKRARSKKVELLSKIYDHAKKEHSFGFRLLTLGWSDGNTFLPVNFCLMSSVNKDSRLCEASEKVDTRTNGGKQRKLAQTKATEALVELLKYAKKFNTPASYVLFDTWFCIGTVIASVKELGYEIIGMVKKSSKVFYLYNGVMQSVTSIYDQNRKRCGRAKYLLSVDAAIVKKGKTIPIRLVYVRNRTKKNEYIVLLSTDITLNPEEIIRIYGKRWDIEIFFKVCKSYLNLEKETQSISYDAMSSHVAIVFSRYMLLAIRQREEQDQRSIGDLFYICTDELPDIRYAQALQLILDEFSKEIGIQLKIDENSVNKLLAEFIAKIPEELRKYLPNCA